MPGSGRGAGCESVRAGCLGVSARLWKEGCTCADGADGARHPLRSGPVIRSCGRTRACVQVWGLGGRGAGAAQGRVGTPGGSPGPRVCMVLHPARACWVLPGTRLYTEGDRGPAWRWGLLQPAPQAVHSAMPGCARRHALGVPGRGRNIPPVCRPAQAAPAAPGPAPLPASSGEPGRGGPALAQVELDVALARPVLEPRSPPPGRAVPGARIRALGACGSRLTPQVRLRAQRRLLWLRGGDLPAGHTARGVGAPA